jgi:iron complex transport system substrate-binding protein
MKIVSLLPGSTEMVCALGLSDSLAGVTHECDYPPEVKAKLVVVRPSLELNGLAPDQIDEAVRRSLRAGRSLYAVDEALVGRIAPDLIIAQDLCQVCAPSGEEIGRVIRYLPKKPRVLLLNPNRLDDIFQNILDVGAAVDRPEAAFGLVGELKDRVNAVSEAMRTVSFRPRVFCMEWLDPPYNGGHWMPELVTVAGGTDGLGEIGRDSKRVPWEEVLEFAPEILILCPCGYDRDGTIAQLHLLTRYPDWRGLPAVRGGRVFAVDANSYFARPGPRVVDGLELVASLIHPERFKWSGPESAVRAFGADDLSRAAASIA